VADQTAIETIDLRKTYDGVEALAGLTFAVPRGSICGFLGRNGAGKTTTLKILLGLAQPSRGGARVLGLDPTTRDASVAIRRRAAFVSDEKSLYDTMTVGDMVRFTASFFPTWRQDLEARYIAKFDLPKSRKVAELSRGMRTKLALLLALSRGAEVLLLDEPTSGLDPAMTEEVLQALVSHVANEEMTIFFSSHQLTDVEQIADRVVLIDRGRTVAEGDIDVVRSSFGRVQAVFEGDAPARSFESVGALRIERRGRVLNVLAKGSADAIVAEARAIGASSVDVLPMTLKEIFLEITVPKE
jgi:ABC-2 type transport system ATP-binding protein